MELKDVTKFLMLPFTIIGAVLSAFNKSEDLKKLLALVALVAFLIGACFMMISSSIQSSL